MKYHSMIRPSNVTILLTLLATALFAGDKNLIKNGSLDEGGQSPEHWEKADGLTSFYIEEKGRGRVIKMDTRVDRKQALEWMKTFKQDPSKKPPKPKFPKNELASIASQEGTMLDSELIPVKKGQNYKLTVDYKGKHKPIVWIKGFFYHPRRKDYADGYQTRLVPENPDPEKWKTFSIGFNPTKRMPKIEKMKVRVYAYWPPGIYYFDNIRVEEISQEEMDQLVKKRGVVNDKPKKK